jgi:hypothetical protein
VKKRVVVVVAWFACDGIKKKARGWIARRKVKKQQTEPLILILPFFCAPDTLLE